MRAGTASRFRLAEDRHLEHVRREVRLGRHVLCSPDVLDRYCEIYRLSGEAHRREVRFEGLPVVASVMPPGTVAFEGEVDQDRMGDW